MKKSLKKIIIILSLIYIIFYLVVDDLIVSDLFDTVINIIISLSNIDFFIATVLLLIGIFIDVSNDKKTNDNNIIKKNIKYKVLKFIGILPFVFVILNGIFSMIFGLSFFFNETYGINAFILTIAFTSLLIWPLYIIGIILIIFSSIKLNKIHNKLKEMSTMKVVGTMFFDNNKLLIDKPRKRPTYQMIGGRVEESETPLEAAVRECHEELGSNAIFDKSLFELVMEFDEIATSDGITPIHFYVFKYNGTLKGSLEISEEIEKFLWYDSSMGNDILSNTLKNEVVPYCLRKKLIK